MIDFPSGEWVGFYTHRGSDKRFLMDLRLEFKGGIMTGDGADGIAEFTIAGSYSEDAGECEWTKSYVGLHSVDYQGFRENKGIWGTWKLDDISGGFHIWPIGQGGRRQEWKEEEILVEQEQPGIPAPLPKNRKPPVV
jgi:hypothetical protein